MPDRLRLTDEQQALAAHMARRLTGDLLNRLGLIAVESEIWDRLRRGGMPFAGALAPHLLARVQEHRWRALADRAVPVAPPAPGTPLPDDWLLACAIADAQRHDADQAPLLAPADLPASLRLTLLTDLAAVSLSLVGANADDAKALSAAVEQAAASDFPPAMEAVVAAAPVDPAATAHALADGNWPALIALIARLSGQGYCSACLWLTTSPPPVLRAALAGLGCPDGAAMTLERLAGALPEQQWLGPGAGQADAGGAP